MLAGKVREQELQIPHPPMPTYNQAQPHISVIPESLAGMLFVIPESLAGMLFHVQERPRLISTQWRATEEDSQPPPLASMVMHTYATPPTHTP